MEEVGFVIIGCGAIAPIHAQSIQEVKGARLVAVADVIQRNAELLGQRVGGGGLWGIPGDAGAGRYSLRYVSVFRVG